MNPPPEASRRQICGGRGAVTSALICERLLDIQPNPPSDSTPQKRDPINHRLPRPGEFRRRGMLVPDRCTVDLTKTWLTTFTTTTYGASTPAQIVTYGFRGQSDQSGYVYSHNFCNIIHIDWNGENGKMHSSCISEQPAYKLFQSAPL